MTLEAVWVMCQRQVKQYWRSKSRLLGMLGQPVLFLVAFGFGFGPVFAKAGQGNYIDFLAPGVIAMSILFTAMFSGIGVIWDRNFGFLKETLVAPVSRTKLMIGRTLGGAIVSTVQGMVVFFLALIVGFRPHHWLHLPLALLFMFIVAFLFTAFGTAIASRLEDMQAFPLIMNFIIMPLFFLSGALFPVQGLPKALEIVVRVNPLSYGVDGIRTALTGASVFGLATDFSVLITLALIFTAVGSWLFSRIEL